MEVPEAGLRIGINLFSLVRSAGGMRQYVLQLLTGLVRQSRHHLVLFHSLHSWPSVAGWLRDRSYAERRRLTLIEIQDQQQIYAHAGLFDIWFCPQNVLVCDLLDRPTLATLPDVLECHFPEYFTPEQLAARRHAYPRTAQAATLLLTLSEFSRVSICEHLKVPAEKVRPIALAPSDELLAATPHWPEALGPLPKRFVFYPANLYPHKNHRVLLDAIEIMKGEGHDLGCVFTGLPQQPGVDPAAEIPKRGLDDRVQWHPHVDVAALRFLYEHAFALAFPSRFEGFGLPLVEAMRLGCPVIAASVASVPEVVGAAALMIEPTAVSLADALRRLLGDPALREDLIARGRRRADRFQNEHMVVAHLDAFDEAARIYRQPRGSNGPPISWVIHARNGGATLDRTLASLALELTGQDEVLIDVGPILTLPANARGLIDNLGCARVLPARESWLDAARHEHVWWLRESDCVIEGAAHAMTRRLAEHPEASGVVGEVLARRGWDEIVGLAYRRFVPGAFTPSIPRLVPAAILWRKGCLERHRDLLGLADWAARMLEREGDAMPDLARAVAYFCVGGKRRWLPRRPPLKRWARLVWGRLRSRRLSASGLEV